MEMEPLPDFLTVDEAAIILRISRANAYQLVGLGFATGGREGIRALRAGRQIRIPLRELEVLNGGPLSPRRASKSA